MIVVYRHFGRMMACRVELQHPHLKYRDDHTVCLSMPKSKDKRVNCATLNADTRNRTEIRSSAIELYLPLSYICCQYAIDMQSYFLAMPFLATEAAGFEPAKVLSKTLLV